MRPEAELKILIDSHPELAWLGKRFEVDGTPQPEKTFSRAHLMLDMSYSAMNPDEASAACFKPYSLDEIIDYLTHSHSYYLNRVLPSIAANLERLHHTCDEHTLLIKAVAGLFHNFCENLEAHIVWEEQGLLNYAKSLSSCEKSGHGSQLLEDFCITSFAIHHPDHRNELAELGGLLNKLEQFHANNMAFRMVKKQISDLESDLALHGLIEDEVLLEKVRELRIKLEK